MNLRIPRITNYIRDNFFVLQLNLWGDREVTGKDRDSDLREGKRTVLVAKAMAAASAGSRAVLDRLGSPDLSAEEIEAARTIIRDSGALSETQSLIEDLAGRARAALDPRLIPPEACDLLGDLVGTVTLRSR